MNSKSLTENEGFSIQIFTVWKFYAKIFWLERMGFLLMPQREQQSFLGIFKTQALFRHHPWPLLYLGMESIAALSVIQDPSLHFGSFRNSFWTAGKMIGSP